MPRCCGFHDEDLALKAFLEQVTIQEIPEVQVPSSTVSGRFLEQEVDVPVRDTTPPDVSGWNVEQMVDVPVAVPLVLDQLVPQERAQQRSVEQVVHAHAPPDTVSERNVEQAVDVHRTLRCSWFCTRFAARNTSLLVLQLALVWMLSAGAIRRVFSHPFPPEEKGATVTSQPSAELVSHSSLSAPSAQSTWIDGDVVWNTVRVSTRSVLGEPQHVSHPVARAVGVAPEV